MWIYLIFCYSFDWGSNRESATKLRGSSAEHRGISGHVIGHNLRASTPPFCTHLSNGSVGHCNALNVCRVAGGGIRDVHGCLKLNGAHRNMLDAGAAKCTDLGC